MLQRKKSLFSFIFVDWLSEFCSLMKGAFESFARQAALLHKQKSVTEKSLQQSVVNRSRLRQSS